MIRHLFSLGQKSWKKIRWYFCLNDNTQRIFWNELTCDNKFGLSSANYFWKSFRSNLSLKYLNSRNQAITGFDTFDEFQSSPSLSHGSYDWCWSQIFVKKSLCMVVWQRIKLLKSKMNWQHSINDKLNLLLSKMALIF